MTNSFLSCNEFQRYCNELECIIPKLYAEGAGSQFSETELARRVLPLVMSDEDERSTELFDKCLEDAPEKIVKRELPFTKFAELRHSRKMMQFEKWSQDHFKYSEQHEESNGFCRIKHMPTFLKPILSMLDEKESAYGEAIKSVLREASDELCASHVVNVVIFLPGMRELELIWPFIDKIGWWRENSNESFLKRAKNFTTAIRKGVPPEGAA